MSVIYKKAPISEIVLGITYNDQVLNQSNVIFDIISNLKKEYPQLFIQAPIGDEDLKGNKLIFEPGSPNITGPGVYRLKSLDNKYLVQLQFNKIYYNWIRGDQEAIGKYPGYEVLFEKFKSVLDKISKIVTKEEKHYSQYKNVKYYELLYQDRFIWKDYIDSLFNLGDIINLSLPILEINNNKINPVNILSNYSFPLEEIGGYSKLSVLTKTIEDNNQLIIVENVIRGNKEGMNFESWFNKSHSYQIDFFEKFFKKDILDKWK